MKKNLLIVIVMIVMLITIACNETGAGGGISKYVLPLEVKMDKRVEYLSFIREDDGRKYCYGKIYCDEHDHLVNAFFIMENGEITYKNPLESIGGWIDGISLDDNNNLNILVHSPNSKSNMKIIQLDLEGNVNETDYFDIDSSHMVVKNFSVVNNRYIITTNENIIALDMQKNEIGHFEQSNIYDSTISDMEILVATDNELILLDNNLQVIRNITTDQTFKELSNQLENDLVYGWTDTHLYEINLSEMSSESLFDISEYFCMNSIVS